MPKHRVAPSIRRTAEAISRRASLVTLGGTVLAAAIPGSSPVGAKKKGKNAKKCKNKNKNEDNANDQCEGQGPPCLHFAEQFCELFNPPGPPRVACTEAASLCCLPLQQCQGPAFFDCLLGRIQSI